MQRQLTTRSPVLLRTLAGSSLLLAGALLVVPASCGGSTTQGAAGSAGTGGSGNASSCDPACSAGRECCSNHCVNPANDPQNCGDCSVKCGAGTYCTTGKCVTPPCNAGCPSGTVCCGTQCCAAGQLCCDPQGPLVTAPMCAAPTAQGTCPLGCAPLCVCASPDTPIATPTGDRPIAELSVGDWVYSMDRDAIVLVPIVETARTPVAHHRVVRVVLANGGVLEISARHPTADGRSFADLRAGDALGGVGIAAVSSVPYAHAYTYDILPGSSSGAYFAAGVPIGSTLLGRHRGTQHDLATQSP